LRFLKSLFSSHKKDDTIRIIEKKLNYTFQNPQLLNTALTHRSLFSNPAKNYERLEFLGDAVLDHVISEWLFNNYPDLDEGNLTKKRASLVNRQFLGFLSHTYSIIDYVKVDSGVDLKDEKVALNIAADVYESVVGAIFLDGGESQAVDFINRTLVKNIKHADENQNYKGTLIELCHRKGFESPQFELMESIGPEHDKIFHINVKLSNGEIYSGDGRSKKSAEQQAARCALEAINTG
jgi:ribonuclease-3